MDGDTFRRALSHRLGLRMCRTHKCSCGATIDDFALHPTSCKSRAGQHSRHASINDVIQHVLNVAGCPTQHEPVSLDRGEGKQPKGITVSPFTGGQSMIWDAACCNICSQTGIVLSAVQSGSCLQKAEGKVATYLALINRLQPNSRGNVKNAWSPFNAWSLFNAWSPFVPFQRSFLSMSAQR